MKTKAVIFDMDGTIVNSENEKALSHCIVLKKNNSKTEVLPETYKNCIGNSFEYVSNYFLEKGEISIPLNLYKEQYNIAYFEKLKKINKPIEGFYQFLNSIKQLGIKTGLVTSSTKSMVDIVIRNLNLTNQFDVIITKDNVTKEKPNSEPYDLAYRFLKTEECVVFEDTTAGFISASHITKNIFAIKHTYNEYQDFKLVKESFSSYSEININKIL